MFEKAYSLFSDGGATESLDSLKTVYEHLQSLDLGDRVLIDLGLVNQAEYYTGLIFRGYFDGVGEPVLSGGRYDNLISDFGAPLPATGFAFNVDAAASVSAPPESDLPDVLVFSDSRHLAQAISHIRSLTRDGLTVENSVFDQLDAAVDYARKRGIRRLHLVDDRIQELDPETL